jgi:hypothetical protein
MLIITSKQHGFRRCGVAHPAEPTEHPDGTFTPEQIEILHQEPMLVVLEAEGGKNSADPDSAKPPGKLPATVAIAAARAADSSDVLDQMAEGETRKTVIDAIAARRQELEA